MQIDDTTLMALADGELDPAEADRLRALIAEDPVAQARLRQFIETRERLRQLAGGADAGPADAALIAMIRAASVPDARSAAAPAPARRPANRNRAPLAALAAALTALAIGLGWWQMPGSPGDGLAPDLVAALDALPSGEGAQLADGRDLTILASYRNRFSELCREYETHQGEAMQLSVACRGGGGGETWVARFETRFTAPEGYLPASGEIEALDSYLADTGAGAPLTPEEEAAALAR